MPPRARALVLAAALLAARPDGGAAQLTRFPWASLPDSAGLGVVPLTVHTAFRSGWTDDRDNGALWAGKGLSALVRGGVAWRRGPLRVVLAPEAAVATNGRFVLADGVLTGPGRLRGRWSPDLPRRWGDGSAVRFLPGQSHLGAQWEHLSLGLTTENAVRGPEIRYPLVLGVSAPGAPTLFLGAGGTWHRLGRIHLRAQWSLLEESPWFDDDPGNDRTLFSGVFADWTPASVPGLTLGASYTFRDPLRDGLSARALLRPLSIDPGQSGQVGPGDAMIALHGAWSAGPAGVWGTWGRGDHWINTEDLLSEADHSQIYAVGASIRWTRRSGDLTLLGERASVVGRSTVRGNALMYRHVVATKGHTHLGQMLGSSLGPGSAGTFLSLRHSGGGSTAGVEVERILRDLDLYNVIFRRRDGASGEDREWRLAGLYEGPLPGFTGRLAGVRGLSVLANGGLSLRWNRDYVRYSANADRVGPRETQLFLDLVLRWDPRAR